MIATLAPPQRQKLVKLLALLSSDHLGERAAAAAAAHRLVTSAGLSWTQLLEPTVKKTPPHTGTWRTTVAKLLRRPDDLIPWERGFLANLLGLPRLSTKQHCCLNEISDRVFGKVAK